MPFFSPRLSSTARRWTLTGLVIIAVVGICGWAYLSLRSVADDLVIVRDELEGAVGLVRQGDVGGARDAFARAESVADDASNGVRSPAVALVGFLPKLDITVDSVVASTEASRLIARAGHELFATVADIPGGLDALTLGGGGQAGWLDAALQLQQPLADANAMLQLAHELVQTAPSTTSSSQVDAARATLLEELASVLPTVDDVAALVEVLPELFGGDGERRYFLGAQNPAELRGTGGFVGAYAILTADAGRISISRFSPIQDLPQDLFGPDVAPGEEFLERYELVIAGLGTWLNVNFSPHFPAVAQTIEAMYRQATGERLDGTIFVDPFALEAMLAATGPVTVPDPDIGTLASDSVVGYVVNEAPLALGIGGERKEILGEAARAVLGEFLSGNVEGRRRIEALAAAVDGGHLVMHAASPNIQAALSRLDATGALPSANQTALSVAINNTALSKADFWLRQQISWSITLDPDGTASATAVVEVTNAAPADPSIPRYIIGPGVPELAFGESWPFITLLCGQCDVRSVRYDDPDDFGAPSGSEQGHTLVDVRPRLGLGDTVAIEYAMELPNAWRRAGSGGEIDLQVWTPPQINAALASVEVRAPAGWAWTDPDDPDVVVEGAVLRIPNMPLRDTMGPFALRSSP